LRNFRSFLNVKCLGYVYKHPARLRNLEGFINASSRFCKHKRLILNNLIKLIVLIQQFLIWKFRRGVSPPPTRPIMGESTWSESKIETFFSNKKLLVCMAKAHPICLAVIACLMILPNISAGMPTTANNIIHHSSFIIPLPPPDTFTAILTLSDSIICPGACVRLTIGELPPGVMISFMIPPGGQPDPTQPGVLCFIQPGNYTITLRAEMIGEPVQLVSQSVKVMSMRDEFPNAFTPNGDKINDTYQPLFRCPVITTNFAIYNRWGEQVFSSTDPAAAWDGTVDGEPAPADVYGWRLEYEALRDNMRQTITEKGDVTLLR